MLALPCVYSEFISGCGESIDMRHLVVTLFYPEKSSSLIGLTLHSDFLRDDRTAVTSIAEDSALTHHENLTNENTKHLCSCTKKIYIKIKIQPNSMFLVDLLIYFFYYSFS